MVRALMRSGVRGWVAVVACAGVACAMWSSAAAQVDGGLNVGASSDAGVRTDAGTGTGTDAGTSTGVVAAVAASRGVPLRRCIELAERNHPNIFAARARLKGMRAQLDEARFTPFSQFTVTGGLGLAPTVRGTDLYSPNTEVSLSSSMGLAWRIGFEGVVPLWTFGKMTNLWNAAEAQINVGEGDLAKQKNQVKLDVRRA